MIQRDTCHMEQNSATGSRTGGYRPGRRAAPPADGDGRGGGPGVSMGVAVRRTGPPESVPNRRARPSTLVGKAIGGGLVVRRRMMSHQSGTRTPWADRCPRPRTRRGIRNWPEAGPLPSAPNPCQIEGAGSVEGPGNRSSEGEKRGDGPGRSQRAVPSRCVNNGKSRDGEATRDQLAVHVFYGRVGHEPRVPAWFPSPAGVYTAAR